MKIRFLISPIHHAHAPSPCHRCFEDTAFILPCMKHHGRGPGRGRCSTHDKHSSNNRHTSGVCPCRHQFHIDP